ncbi:MAG: endonuclease/exonuclease/phosphatase family protein [Myxococcota bacterium]
MTTTTRLAALTLGVFAHASVAAEPRELHVLAFNVLFKGADDTKSVKVIADESPDVVCLTELTSAFAKRFEADLAKDYPHRAFEPKVGTWGVGFASKRPLSDVRVGPVAPSKIPAMEATVSLEGKPVRLVCVHLIPPAGKHRKSDGFFETLEKNAAVRKKQADTLVARFASTKLPVVLLGDFNEEPGGKALTVLEKSGWSRGCSLPKASCTPTFPGPAEPWPAVFTIDHVFARGLDFTDARTVRGGGSDHFPVGARLVLPATK